MTINQEQRIQFRRPHRIRQTGAMNYRWSAGDCQRTQGLAAWTGRQDWKTAQETA